MEIPLVITVKTEDVGATQEATFYLNGKEFVSYRTHTGHEDRSLEIAIQDFGDYLGCEFLKHLNG